MASVNPRWREPRFRPRVESLETRVVPTGVIQLTLQEDNGAVVTVTNTDPSGSVVYEGNIGLSGASGNDLSVIVSFGTSNSPGGADALVENSNSIVQNNTGSPHTLHINVSAQDFTSPNSPPSLTLFDTGSGSLLYGSLSGDVHGYADATNALFGTGFASQDLPLSVAGNDQSYSSSGSVFGFAPGGATYSVSVFGNYTLGGNTIVSGMAANDQTESQYVALSGNVYQDHDASGTLTSGDTPIPNVTLSLTDSNGNLVATTTTASNGSYAFTTTTSGQPIAPGTYNITETQPNGYLQGSNTVGTVYGTTDGTLVLVDTIGNIVLTAGEDSINNNFGELLPVSINGNDYLVSNTTTAGSLTTSTTGNTILGTTITLTGTDAFGNAVNTTTTTNAAGQYSFTGLYPSNSNGYTVTETPPSTDTHLGQTSTTTGAVATPATPVLSAIVVNPGQTSTDNFFETAAVTLNGTDYLVSNNATSGSLTTSTTGIAIPGTTVVLTGTDAFGNAVSATTTTNASGQYSFAALNPSNGSGYTVTETPPAIDTHLGQTSTTIGAVSTAPANPVVSNIVLTANGATSTDNYFETATVSINGTDFLDSNGNVTQQGNEPGIAGTTVTLTGTDEFGNAVSLSTTTGATGVYSFAGLNPSNGSGYTVTEVVPSGYTHEGQISNSSGAVTTPATASVVSNIVLTTPGSNSTDNFAESASVSINGNDYLVPNTTASGNLTPASTGIAIPGTTVTLTGTDVFGNTVNSTVTTDATGLYNFTGLAPSNSNGYTVTETPPATDTHVGQTSTTGGTVSTPATTPAVSKIVLTTNGATSSDNFAETATVSINGTDYLVSNSTSASSLTTSSTGIAIPGTTVILTGTDEFGNAVSATTSTSSSGQYSFTGLNPSNGNGYTVTEMPPATDTHLGQTSTTGGAVSTPATTPVVSKVVLTTNGATSTDIYFEAATVSVNGTDYLVSNTTSASGLTTATTGIAIAGTTVKLSGTDEFGNAVSATTTTNSSGQYSFTGLNPSNGSGYTVTETPPATDTHLGQTSTTGGAVSTPATTPVVSKIVLTTNGATSTDNYFEAATVSVNGTDYLVSNTTSASGLTTSSTGIAIAGTTVKLSGTDEFGNAVSATTTTNSSGQYSFTGLNPSNGSGYTVTETPPAADTHVGQTSTTGGAINTPAGTPVVSKIVLTTNGATSTDNYFETATVSVNGTDYLVSNTTSASGLTTSSSGIAIAGTTVKLSGTDEFGNAVSATTTTNSSGQYSFTGLNPSNGSGYTVTETPPATDTHLGQTSTTGGAVSTPATTPVVSKIVLTTNGATSTDNYFETATVSINGTDFVDSNSDLVQQSGELGISGTTITLSGTDEFGNTVTKTTTTNSTGQYSFTGLNPSNGSGYTVTETIPSSYTHEGQTSNTSGAVSTPLTTPAVSKIVLTTNGASSTENFAETANNGVISGFKFLDKTGAGFSSDDTGLAGVTINLYLESNNTAGLQTGTDSADKLVATQKTLSDGSYSFANLAAGTYYVEETVPTGYVQTGGGPNGTAGSTYYTVAVQNGHTYTGNNFDDFQIPTCQPTNVCYVVNNNNWLNTVSDLSGKTQQGDSVTVTFTVSAGMNDQLSLVSYIAPSSSFNSATAYQQQIFDVATGVFTPGTHSLTVLIPNSYYQIDFICGSAISVLGPQNYGPDSDNIFYTAESRLISHDNGGTQACSTKTVGSGDFAAPSYWTTTTGQNLIKSLNGSSNATSLGQWLATTFPNLYGSGAGSHSMVNSNGSYFTNSQVASVYSKFTGGDAQVLSAALSVYSTSINLAGENVHNIDSHFNTSLAGSGMDTYNVGANGSAFGVSNNTTWRVMQLLVGLNANTAAGAALASGGNAVVSGINVIGNVTNASLTSDGLAYTPDQVRTAYGINGLSLDGTGQTIAIVDAYDDPSIFQSVDTFDAQFGVTASGSTLYQQYGSASSFLTVMGQDGSTTSLPGTDPAGAGNDNWEVEEALDVEWAHAVAPGAQIILVEANSQSLSDLMAGVGTAANQPGVSVVSMSWGFPEGQTVLAQDEATYDGVFTTPAGHQGVTFVASTGDYGTNDPEYPAFSPNVVAVGGSSLYLNADNSYNSETGWGYNSTALGTLIGSGGGVSQYELEPAYQQGFQSTGFRTTPDVSFLADPATGAWISDSYNDPSNPYEIVGGTSLASPAMAATFALVNQGRVAAGNPTLNSSSPTETQQDLYSLPQSDFNSITSGTNGGYNAAAGYNLVTGLGTPVTNLFVNDLIAGNFPSSGQVAPIDASLNANSGYSGGSGGGTSNAMNVFAAISMGSGLEHAPLGSPSANPVTVPIGSISIARPVTVAGDAAVIGGKIDATNFAATGNTQLLGWLQNGNAADTANLLSTQLATTTLSVKAGYLQLTTPVQDANLLAYQSQINGLIFGQTLAGFNYLAQGGLNNSGYISLGDLMIAADFALEADNSTGSSDANRPLQEAIETALAALNNDDLVAIAP